MMLLFGLTGGIGAGKSTVSALLAECGAVVIDADAIVHELQQPGQPVLNQMVEAFGPSILAGDGTLDRPAVAALVFNDAARLELLGSIVHPAVQERMFADLAREAGTDHVVILDVPLLVEHHWEGMLGVIVVDVDPAIALRRLVAARGMSEEDARARMSRQATREERNARAAFLIDNSGTLADLKEQVSKLWDWIEGHRP